MGKKLNIAFLWHMHQPLYKDPFSLEYALPWVQYHCTKDYYDMLAVLDEFPLIKQTFNIVPSLIEQIRDYESEDVRDRYRRLTAKDASALTREDKIFLLEFFFQCNWVNMVRPSDHYWSLLSKRGLSGRKEDLEEAVRFFHVDEYRDLQFLFNFSWIDPWHVDRDDELKKLKAKGRQYTEEDKKLLLKKQTGIIRSILPKYKEMNDKGRVELTTTPYFHPILPLLCDTDSALEAMPWAKLPQKRFAFPEDASAQIEMALKLFESVFGKRPSGMWPSEGSVSSAAITQVARHGVKWIATDEDILAKSIGTTIKRDVNGNPTASMLYRPYEHETPNGKVSMIFRDRILSDLIGFDYAKMDPEKAASDFMARLDSIYSVCADPEKSLVSVILDGENAWESYANDGWDFLRALYSKISESDKVRAVTVSEFLESDVAREKLARVASGSWINSNFRIWIGHVEDNAAWDCVYDAREAIKKYESSPNALPDKIDAAWRSLYAAQGSDWYWWYGDDHASMNDIDFDNLFRSYIKHVYATIGAETPTMLDIPIISEERGFVPQELPSSFMNPSIDGMVTNYFEWLASAPINRSRTGGAMHGGDVKYLIKGMHYGFNLEKLFLRFDYDDAYLTKERICSLPWHFTIVVLYPVELRIRVSVDAKSVDAQIYERAADREWTLSGKLEDVAAGQVLEIALPFSLLKAASGTEMRFFIDVWGDNIPKERCPERGYLSIKVPDENFESEHWVV